MPTPALEAGTVDILQTRLAHDPVRIDRLISLLTKDELRRAERLVDPDKRALFVAGRGYLRETLAGYLGTEPQEIGLCFGEFGKPALDRVTKGDFLHFNLSHAGNLLLLAITRNNEVGIDLEQISLDLPYAAMAKQFFSTRETAELFSLPQEEQLVAFYRCWTRKEAYIKGTGTGFSQPANQFDVSLLPGYHPEMLQHRLSPVEAAHWRLQDIAVPEGYQAALAYRGEQSPALRMR